MATVELVVLAVDERSSTVYCCWAFYFKWILSSEMLKELTTSVLCWHSKWHFRAVVSWKTKTNAAGAWSRAATNWYFFREC